ncbi:MAG: TolC family protein [Alistipes sp.]|nr:TolC family protein [Alistipes sp.]
MKRKASIRALTAALIILFSPPAGHTAAGAADTVRIDIQDAIAIGISRSVDAVAAKNQHVSSYWGYRTYLTELLPIIEFGATIPELSRSFNRFQNEDGSYTYVGNNYNFLSTSLSVSQNIPWTGGKLVVQSDLERLRQKGTNSSTHYRSIPFSVTLEQQLGGFNNIKWLRKIEPLKYDEATKTLASQSEEIALVVIQYYFNLLLGKINLEIAEQNYRNAERLYQISQARHEMGQLSDIDLMQMHSSLLSAESDMLTARSSLDNRMFQLRSYLGFGEDTILDPELPGNPCEKLPELAYGEVLEKALENNAFTLNTRRRMLESTRDVNQARADRWGVTLYASFGMSAQESNLRRSYSVDRWHDDQSITVGIRVPILDWGKGKGKVRIAQANREVEMARIEKEEMDFRQDIFMQVKYFNDQPEKLGIAARMDEIALKRYETSVEAFVLGKIDILSLNDSQGVKDDARRNYIDQLNLLWAYHYRIRALTLYDFTQNAPIVYETVVKK